MSDKSLDEARFNLATHIMSNGVELIIASDRVKHTEHKSNSIPSSRHTHHTQTHTPNNIHTQDAKKPVTFAPSTLMNHMILALPTTKQVKFGIVLMDRAVKDCHQIQSLYSSFTYVSINITLHMLGSCIELITF